MYTYIGTSNYGRTLYPVTYTNTIPLRVLLTSNQRSNSSLAWISQLQASPYLHLHKYVLGIKICQQ